MCEWLKRKVVWILTDIRSAVVGAAVGSVITFLGTVLAYQPQKHFVFGVSADGYGQPKSLFRLPQLEAEGVTLQFHPPDLENVYVCEHKILTGPSWKHLLLSYFNEYPMCFHLFESGKSTYSIYPNRISGRLRETGDGNRKQYFCKCGS